MRAKDFCFASDKSFQVQQPAALIASGSSWNGLPMKKANISENPKLTLIAGSDDKYASERSKLFSDELKNFEAHVTFISFLGGHHLDENSLLKTLKEGRRN